MQEISKSDLQGDIGGKDETRAARQLNSKSPEDEASIISKLFFSWAQPLFATASARHKIDEALELEDLIPLQKRCTGENLGPIFEKAWNEQDVEKATIITSIRAVIGRPFILAGGLKAVNTSLQFSFPLLLNYILKFIEDTQAGKIDPDGPWYDTNKGYWLSALLATAMVAKALTESYYFHMANRSGYQVRAAISIAVYNKVLRLTSAERHETTLGEMINLMQVDASKIEMFVPQFHILWDGVFQITGYLAILYSLIGWPCFAGLVVMLLAGPIQGIIMKNLFGLNHAMVKYTDERVKKTNEAVQGIRCVKMYTWEESFQKVIAEWRQSELDMLKKMSYLRGASKAYMGALPQITAVVSFVVYALAYKGNISASTLFAALIAFYQLRFPLLFYPMTLAQYAQASVSAKRVEAFMRLKEVRNDEALYNKNDESLRNGEILVNDLTIYWGDPKTPISNNKGETDSDLGSSRHSSTSDKSNNKKGKKNSTDDNNSEVQEVRYHQPVLSNVNVKIVPGELLAIIGRVGSGKSTLCSAILNEAVIGQGSVALNGTIAYAAQNPWIMNATLRDNITFGKIFDQKKYDKIIRACQMTVDLSLLEHGDMTEIGENGINLSGGQRQRVSIARAVYSEADIVLMDDPLSALDPEVGNKLFDECILDLMKNKTRILVTNQLQYLHLFSTVIALDQGKVSEQGTFAELSKNGGDVAKLIQDLEGKGKSSSKSQSSNQSSKGRKRGDSTIQEASNDKEKETENKGLISEEERNTGAISLDVYKKYLRVGGGNYLFFFIFLVYILCVANDLLNTLWVTIWTSDADYERQPQAFYLGFYSLSACTAGLFTFLRSMFLARFAVKASKELHTGLLASILRAPMSFFDTTPTGRIISRFSKDLYAVDLEVTDNMDFAIFSVLTIVVSFGTIVFVTPWFGIALVPMMFIYIKILNYFREVSRETKRLESISRSPVFVHFSETLGGISTIQAYNQADRFISEFEGKVDSNTLTTYNNKTADRWLTCRLETLGAFIAGLAAVFACRVVLSTNTVTIASSTNNFASMAGLSLNYAISVTGLLNWVIRTFAQLEATMNSVERVLYYSEEIPQEAPARSKDLQLILKEKLSSADNHAVPPSVVAIRASGGVESLDNEWPSNGKIILKNLKMRYRPENPLVIKGLDVEIDGGSRVGVVGRTGSGKSSLLLTLLRIVEPTLQEDYEYEPPITVDDIDILRVGLTDLRSAVAIIPQSPVLFSGTIRSNMDPFNEFADEDIWNALEGCGMKDTVEEMHALLNAPVAEYGDNLSQGQRQLLCLGRALLKHCRILLLDEATSSIDYETDKEIQRTLREAFAGCTVLTIAHRVNTIMDSDKILVMVDGKVGEFASPDDLLADNNSFFSDIVKEAQGESF